MSGLGTKPTVPPRKAISLARRPAPQKADNRREPAYIAGAYDLGYGRTELADVTGESLVARRKRALFRSRHRGTAEMDIVLGGFADAHLEGFDAPMLTRFEALLRRSDAEITAWLTGAVPAPPDADAELVTQIAAHHRRKARS